MGYRAGELKSLNLAKGLEQACQTHCRRAACLIDLARVSLWVWRAWLESKGPMIQAEIWPKSMRCLKKICLYREPSQTLCVRAIMGSCVSRKQPQPGIETEHKIRNTWPSRGAGGRRLWGRGQLLETRWGQWMAFSWAARKCTEF